MPSSSSLSVPSPLPPPEFLTQEELKQIAAYKAVEFVESRMVLGLGSSTTKYAIERIGELLHQGKLKNIVDPYLNLMKSRGGSLLKEKMIEGACRKFVVIVDEPKMVPYLGGSGLAMPVEIVSFYSGCVAKLRTQKDSDEPFVADNANYIVELYFEKDIGDLNADTE
ncbi:hypothetical protein NE237_027970 [Protea cynaroides]|uniref:ribose-5-phosphate isomerase n=1 Tax=Protea cynaroides TaxID=273540 RepID=A0A9Q0JUV3_9MAGN|nr:hypothetical protein NE237_027970 [Protea cynaroides]